MLVIANQLFILRSYNVEGCVLECGCFKGYSSCWLSIASRRVGYPMVIADSFAGLPPDPDMVGEGRIYNVGDYAGARLEVERNLRTYDDPAGVEMLEGWFSETLKSWSRPLALLWLDVDLPSSVSDVLDPCLAYLDPKSVIFSHEFESKDINGSKIIEEKGPTGAIARAMQKNDHDYTAAHVRGYLGVIARRTSVCPQSYQLVNELIHTSLRRVPSWLLSKIKNRVARAAGIRADPWP